MADYEAGSRERVESSRKVAICFATYTLAIFALAASLRLLVVHGGLNVFLENGPVEWLQWVMLVATAYVFFDASQKLLEFKTLCRVFACFAAWSATRELDKLLDQLIPVLGWKIAFIFPIYAAVILMKDWKTWLDQAQRLLPLRSFGVLWAGFIVTVPFAQMVGHGPFLESLLGSDLYKEDYKRVVQESAELVGYCLLLIGSSDCVRQLNVEAQRRE